MSKWSKGIRKMLSAAGISFLIATGAIAMPLCASAATAVTDGVMIRNDASTEAGIIGSLNEGDEVTILDVIQSGDGYAWYYIELDNGNKGYVRSDLLSASEEELRQFGGAPVNEEQEEPEEETEEKEEKAEEKTEAEAEKKDEKKEEEKAEETPAEAATGQEAPAASEDYDASKDPNAHFSVKFETEADGSGNWYVYNDDNGSRIKISDMKESAEKADSSKSAGLWKPAAIIFGLLTLALSAFVLFLIKSIRDGRSKSSRRRSLEVAGYTPYEEEGGEEEDAEDEYYFTDDEEGEAGEETADSTIEAEVPKEEEPVDLPSGDETDAEIGAVTDGLRKAVQDLTESEAEEAPDEVPAQKEEAEAEEAADEEPASDDADDTAAEEVQMAPADEDEEEPASDPFDEEEAPETDAGEDYISEEEGLSEEDFEEDFDEEDSGEEYSDEEDYEEEDFEEEDFDEEEFDEEDYDEEDYEEDAEDYSDDEDSRTRSRRKDKGGFFGFIKKVFGSDSREDSEDEGEDFDAAEEDEHEFDEFSEYPEDIDLLPREESAEDDFAKEEDFDADPAADTGSGNARGRLSMQRVMKNVGYKEEENDFSDSDLAEDDDLTESLFDDDDDMSFSFIGSSRKK